MKRLAALAALTVLGCVVILASRSNAQVPPIPLPLPTTTVAPAPPPPSTSPPTTETPVEAPTPVESTDTTMATDTTLLPVEIPPIGPAVSAPTSVTTARPRAVALPSGIRPASVTGAYGLGVGGALLIALVLVVFTTIARSQLLPGGSTMTAQRRARLLIGLACLALAAVVGLVGYLKLSLEPDVNRQIPYLASAGMALVLLSAVGGAFIVGEQMRTDQQRIEELEAAVKQLATMVAPTVEAPARTRATRKKKA